MASRFAGTTPVRPGHRWSTSRPWCATQTVATQAGDIALGRDRKGIDEVDVVGSNSCTVTAAGAEIRGFGDDEQAAGIGQVLFIRNGGNTRFLQYGPGSGVEQQVVELGDGV